MGLKLTVTRGDKIICSNGIVIDIITTSDKQTMLEFHAPRDIKIDAVFLDSSKQFKNMQKGLAASTESALADIDGAPVIEPGQSMTVEDQRREALRGMNKRNRR